MAMINAINRRQSNFMYYNSLKLTWLQACMFKITYYQFIYLDKYKLYSIDCVGCWVISIIDCNSLKNDDFYQKWFIHLVTKILLLRFMSVLLKGFFDRCFWCWWLLLLALKYREGLSNMALVTTKPAVQRIFDQK